MGSASRIVSAVFVSALCVFAAVCPISAPAQENAVKEDAGSVEGKGAPEKKGEKGGTEDEIFSEENTVTPSEKIKDDNISGAVDKKSLSFNGFLNSRNSYLYRRGSVLRQTDVIDNNDFLSYFQGDFALDARLVRGIKGYVNFSADCYPAGLPKSQGFQVPVSYLGYSALLTRSNMLVSDKTSSYYSINEMFIDVNFDKAVYFRAGKQTLKWGTGILWTPTDLINIEKKNILDSSQVRQGTYGLKIHVPFGTAANLYSFVNMQKVSHANDIGGAVKLEVLLKNTEVSVSAVAKNRTVPVYGCDFTSRLFLVDVHGEACMSYGDNARKMREFPWYLYATTQTGAQAIEMIYLNPGTHTSLDYRVSGRWIPKASLGFGKGFDVKDIKDRVRIDFEFFYNGSGYLRNMFDIDAMNTGYFLSRGLYTPNYYSRYYGGAFITVKQIFIEEISAGLNYIINMCDKSSVVSGLISYSPVYDLSLNLMVNGFIGRRNREYTVLGNYLTTELSVKLVF
ncbi:MAG: hypothetical protein MUD12_12115 [Spirochaetes bacterium]|jgi:hypothetical protein|nr:hypothetical protein [Spirochaetota bacterium]